MTAKVPIDVSAGDTLEFWTWYDIEDDWDYAYVEVSTDGGSYFRSIPGNITTTYNPNGNNAGHGITEKTNEPGASMVKLDWCEASGSAANRTLITVNRQPNTDGSHQSL